MKPRTLSFLYFAFIGIASALLIWWITPFGAGVSPDSIVYLEGAKNIIAGQGYAFDGVGITHFPPLYPIALALAGFFQANPIQAARLVNALVYGINIALCAYAIFLATRRSLMASSIAALFYLSTASLLRLHAMAWSEPLFITLILLCVILLSKHLCQPAWALLIASSLAMGLAMITRYIGLGFLPAAGLMVLIYGGGQTAGSRWRDAFLWCALACAPLGIVLVRNEVAAGSFANRGIGFHPISTATYFKEVALVIGDFIAPSWLSAPIKMVLSGLLAAIIMALILLRLTSKSSEGTSRTLNWIIPQACFLSALSYLVFLFISISFLDAATPVDERLLAPALVLLLVGTVAVVWNAAIQLKVRALGLVLLALAAVLILIRVQEAIPAARAIQTDGLWYTSRQWQESEIIALVKSLGEERRIYSNGWDAIRFLTGRQAISMPSQVWANTMQDNPHFDQQLEAMCADILENEAILVYSDLITWRWYLPAQDELEGSCSLPVLQRLADGTVYGEP